ncbi:MAG: transposase [Rhodopirellula baltica]
MPNLWDLFENHAVLGAQQNFGARMSGRKDPPVEWAYYDTKCDVLESRRNLPHLDMNGVLTFVTFRLADSMPKKVVRQWHEEIENWLQQNGLDGWSVDQVLQSPSVDASIKRELRFHKARRWHGHLDDCHGDCCLRDTTARDVVAQSLRHFDGERYDLERFVIMPNHVHVLLQIRDGFLLRKQLREVLRFSAREINQRLGRCGSLWQSEPFDHIVRSPEQFEYLQGYINRNPSKARLRESEFTLWTREPVPQPVARRSPP